eukprot:TRINITY_DN114143_c0_g1_i1.p1 TRINITY_DN114143_c0_g1~~TRINITY_DN114143_c0_g1_i1.p1  ORF type:complete len:247 (-),score=81.22 TRINITY_DN114143_c0_g1_i1:178-918(-)
MAGSTLYSIFMFVALLLACAEAKDDTTHIVAGGVKHRQQESHKTTHKHKVAKRHEAGADEHVAAAASDGGAGVAHRTGGTHHKGELVEDKKVEDRKVEDKKVEAEAAFSFQALDLNKDGFITEAEYNQALGISAEASNEQAGKQMMRRARTTVDVDHRGEATATSATEALLEEEPSDLLQAKQDPATTAATIAGAAGQDLKLPGAVGNASGNSTKSSATSVIKVSSTQAWTTALAALAAASLASID